ncbi:MAG: hypothetical protein ACRC5A_10945 [Enterobacteriaceae bacterium]
MKELIANKNYYLTQVVVDNESNRVFASCLFGDINNEEWKEVDEDFKKKWETEFSNESTNGEI